MSDNEQCNISESVTGLSSNQMDTITFIFSIIIVSILGIIIISVICLNKTLDIKTKTALVIAIIMLFIGICFTNNFFNTFTPFICKYKCGC